MENYNFVAENIDDINVQTGIFFNLLKDQSNKLIEIDKKTLIILEKTLWSVFINNHLEIRQNMKLTRYFILKKMNKLNKELKTQLYMKNIYDNLLDITQDEYWKFIHTLFILFETAHIDKDDAIINTIAAELLKLENEKLNEKSKEENRIVVNNNKTKQTLNNMMDNLGMNSTDTMTKMLEMAANMTNDKNEFDLSKMMKTFMPDIESKKNDSLMQDLMSDITSSMGSMENVNDVFDKTKKLGEKYQQMISNGDLDAGEILGSLMGLMSDEKFNNELSKLDISKLNPQDMMSKMTSELAPELMKEMTGPDSNLDIGTLLSSISGLNTKDGTDNGISSLLSSLTSTKIDNKDETKLTTEQLKEMEEYYLNTTTKNT